MVENLKDIISNLTLKPLSQTHWKSRFKSVKAIRFQTSQIRDALLKLVEISEDPKLKVKLIVRQHMSLKILRFYWA